MAGTSTAKKNDPELGTGAEAPGPASTSPADASATGAAATTGATAVATSGAQTNAGVPAVYMESENLPDYLKGVISTEDAGLGLSQDPNDNIVPLMYVLQSNSPQVNQRGADAIKGAAPGDLWIKGSAEAIKGDVGIIVQPCAFAKEYVEWVPRNAGGGFVGRHDTMPSDAVEKKDEQGRSRMTRPNGNEVIETRYHFVLVGGSPVVIPFSSTGHTVSRDWMYKMNSVKAGKFKVPAFGQSWRLTTRERTNKAGSWFVIAPEQEGFIASADEYELGREFYETWAKGDIKAAAEDAGQQQSGDQPSYGSDESRHSGSDTDIPF